MASIGGIKPIVVDLWPNGAPTRSVDPHDTARVFVYLPEVRHVTGRAIVICPGGGYEKISDPLEGEKAVLSLYFDFLTSRENGSPFSSEALMIYALKLQILERMNAFDEEKGRAEFDRLYEAIEGNIKG